MSMRIGMGYDVHQLAKEHPLWIGGIQIPSTIGAVGHSDADVLIHAICDALLGALNLRDIGYHFPDNDPELQSIDSKILLEKTMDIIRDKGYELGNIDSTICLERPKINPHIPEMQKILAQTMKVVPDQISIKATTTEKLGFVGEGKGISAYAVALLNKEQL
ncbi:MAG: 2-C-methyl-D-erythritol 2,4-cyclodiphosphate synthase [Bacteroidota bacterium]